MFKLSNINNSNNNLFMPIKDYFILLNHLHNMVKT